MWSPEHNQNVLACFTYEPGNEFNILKTILLIDAVQKNKATDHEHEYWGHIVLTKDFLNPTLNLYTYLLWIGYQ